MRPYRLLVITFLYCLINCCVFAQFPIVNFRSIHTKFVKAPNITSDSSKAEKITIDLSKNRDTLLKTIDDYRAKFQSIIIKEGISSYASRNPSYAINTKMFIDNSKKILTTEINKLREIIPGSAREAVKNDAILTSLEKTQAELTILSEQYKAVNSILGNPKLAARIFPARSYTQAKLVYGSRDSSNFTFANSFTILSSDDKASVNPEIVSGFIGPIRIGINTLISTTEDTSVVEQSQLRLISGGGNTALSLSLAVYRHSSQNVDAFIHLAPKFVADFPLLGATSIERDAFIGSIQMSGEAFIKVSTNEKNLSFFANFRGGQIVGTKQFLNNLGLDKKFDFGQINTGMFFGSNIQVSATLPVFASRSSLLKSPILLTTQFFPKISK